MSKKKEIARDVEARENLEVDLSVAKLKLEMMRDWKNGVTDDDQKTSAALLYVAESESELRSVVQKRNEFEGSLKVVEAESARQPIRLNTMW